MPETDLSSRFDPKSVETKWYEVWESRKCFGADANDPRTDTHPETGQVYCLTIPPPNVTGSLHIGHALQHSAHDCLIRWNRMRGKLTLCVPGTDHASIAVHTVLEKELAREDVSRHDLGREKFLERAWAWKEHYGGIILKQMRLLGCSYDWNRTRFTMDDLYTKAVQLVFVEWFRKGWVYRGYRIINWCPRCQTSLSDLEAPMVEQPGKLYHIRYPLLNGAGQGIVVATTRPETMLGDTAVAVHPVDERYKNLIGRKVLLPLMNRQIPIIADEYVDSEFGTGAVKVTPAHDPNDFDMGQRHALDQILVIGRDARMTDDAGKYRGQDRYECREAVIRDLETEGYLVAVKDYPESRVPRCARCDTVLEPLPLEQWFVRMKPPADAAIRAIQSNEIRYIPERYTSIALEWLQSIRDWNISRQLWWGQRIPAWKCASCEQWTVQLETPDRCMHCGRSELEQDPDVFDTWFSSGIWPQAVLGWPDQTPELERFFPTSLLITDRQILHLWVARMIMSSLDFLQKVPFYDVYVHPTILNWEGRRMSKSLGTGVDPLELIDAYGADATRFGLLYMCSIRQDVRFTEERIEMARNFCNKIWNASRFVLMNVCRAFLPDIQTESLTLPDRWILSRYARTVEAVNKALTAYEFDVASRTLYDFVWSEFCDWFVEFAKLPLREGGAAADRTRGVLFTVLDGTLKLLHPFIPFISEEIWQRLSRTDSDLLMTQSYPQPFSTWIDDEAERQMAVLCDTVRAIRNLRAEGKVSTGRRVNVILFCHHQEEREFLAAMRQYYEALDTRASVSFIAGSDEKPDQALSTTEGNIEIFLSLEGLVDIERELERLTRDHERLMNDIARRERMLADEKFATRAPAHILEGERTRLAESQKQLHLVEERLKQVKR